MTDHFVDSEVDRTKSRWVAKVFQEFGRPRTTLRALFYYALSRAKSDYPICGGFVGEIRITRPYHESDGEKLAKWTGKAQRLGFLPANALLKEEAGEQTFLPETHHYRTNRLELWLNRSAFNPLLEPVCSRHGAVLVSTESPSQKLLQQLFGRVAGQTTVLCLSDLSQESFSFCASLAAAIADARPSGTPEIRVLPGALTPEQLLQWKIPMVPQRKGKSEAQKEYKKFLQAYRLNHRNMAELDALEVYYPRGIAGFCDDLLARYSGELKTAAARNRVRMCLNQIMIDDDEAVDNKKHSTFQAGNNPIIKSHQSQQKAAKDRSHEGRGDKAIANYKIPQKRANAEDYQIIEAGRPEDVAYCKAGLPLLSCNY